jgi:RNA polymerase sigma factor (sigma-70 family)
MLDAVRAELVRKNVALARYLARVAYERNPTELELDEVTSIAYQGLVTAAIRWDPIGQNIDEEGLRETAKHPSGRAFAGYARQRIVGEILDWQRRRDHVQRSYRTIYKTLIAAGFTGSFDQGPSAKTLAAKLGLDEERVRRVVYAVHASPVSVETVQDETQVSHAEYDFESSAVETSIKQAVVLALQQLPTVQRHVVALRYYRGWEFQAIAVELGVSLPVVREAHSEGVIALHAAMRRRAQESS